MYAKCLEKQDFLFLHVDICQGSLHGTHFGWDHAMQMDSSFKGFSLRIVHCLGCQLIMTPVCQTKKLKIGSTPHIGIPKPKNVGILLVMIASWERGKNPGSNQILTSKHNI